jgi:hypothetical protein
MGEERVVRIGGLAGERVTPLRRGGVAGALAGWGPAAAEFWPAWCDLTEFEDLVSDLLGADVGAHVLVLWALSRFGGSPAMLNELIDDDVLPQFGDVLLEDMVEVAFALGAAWAAKRGPLSGQGRIDVCVSPTA